MTDPILFLSKFLLLFGLLAFVGSVMRVLMHDLWRNGQARSEAGFWLEVVEGRALVSGPSAVPLSDEVLIGRGSECGLILKDPEASGRHARFYLRDDEVWVEDLGSTNGTLLEGKSINQSVKLLDGQAVDLGGVRLQLKKKSSRLTSEPRRIEQRLLLASQLLVVVAFVLAVGGLGPAEVGAPPWSYLAGTLGFWWVALFATRRVSRFEEPLLLPCSCLLSGIGWVEVWRLSPELGLKQAAWTALGLGVMTAVCYLLPNVSKLQDYRYLFLVVGVSLQLAVMFFGVEINGARLWFRFGDWQFQPVELVKLLMIAFLAAFFKRFAVWLRQRLSGSDGRLPKRALGLLVFSCAAAVGVLVLQKDLGQALLFIGVFLSMFYVATGRLDLVAVAGGFFVVGSVLGYFAFGHVRVRVQAWLDPFAFFETGGYQMSQALFSLASGGPFGTALGMGEPDRIPEAATDFIFVALAEELGTLGSACLLVLLMVLVSRAFRIALMNEQDFEKLLAVGLGSLLAIQSLILTCGTLKIIPMTGITVPFLSYGGSSTLANFVVLALLRRLSDVGPRHG